MNIGLFNIWKKLKPWVRVSIILILLALLFFLGKSFYQSEIVPTYVGEIEYSESCTEELRDEAEDILCDFTDQFYTSLRDLPGPYSYEDYDQEQIDSYIPNMTSYFKNPEGKSALFWQSSLRFLITGRSITNLNMNLSHITYDIEVLEIKESDSYYTVSYYESASYNFEFMNGTTSEAYHIPCVMKFYKGEDSYKIKSYSREDDFTGEVENFCKGSSKEDIEQAFDSAIKNFKYTLKLRKKQKEDYVNGLVSYDDIHVDVAYNRENALEYATKYVKERNDKEWDVYDDYGGNCQNFASQVLYAGGIPMDLESPGIWKYYDSAVDETSSKYGRSSAWTGAPYFRLYALRNDGDGLVSTVDANLFSAEAGDVLQVGPTKGTISHSNVVIGTAKDSNDQVIDIIVNSNTSNRINWPISASLVGNYSLIKVHGYNK